MPRILIDIDGVLAALLPEWLTAYEMLGGEHIEPADVHHYSMSKVVADIDKCYRALGNVDYADVKPFPGIGQAIIDLRCAGFTLRFVSYCPPSAPNHYAQKIAWLTKHVPGFSPNEAIFCASEEKQFVDGDILVEDYPRTLNEWMRAREEAGYEPRGFLINQTYNQGDSQADPWARMQSLAAVADVLDFEVNRFDEEWTGT